MASISRTNIVSWLFFSLLFVVSSLALSRPLVESSNTDQMYCNWMTKHGRVYKDSQEMAKRHKIFLENVKLIEDFNAQKDVGFKLAVNRFADMTNDEFRASLTGYKMESRVTKPNAGFRYSNDTNPPESIDWRKLGAVTPIKNQGSCGACWAFSAVGAVESINQIKNGKLVSLSEQQLVDCDVDGTNNGCNGGFMDDAFDFIVKNKGLATEEVYPYIGSDNGVCNDNKTLMVSATITGYEDVPGNNETALEMAVANQPVSVAVDAGGFKFQFYSYGIMSGFCSTQLNHGIIAVGYGQDYDSGRKYWLMKNSWGDNWGEDGYLRMAKDITYDEGMCGLAMIPSYPVV
ncbi:ervatamin-B-like [Impatiens glandulifera]|uniref:ervatamin-B-like n=1 Tax=Impatiens glandulifera TaxID=253017 RepID=UPI001FB0757A|nr:ervatamin-B-like [Impatiens glandulifera]